MANYEGMRWFKCDLHMHTPEENANWTDDDMRLGNPRRPSSNGSPDETGIQDKARRFLRRCHDLGLEVIGVTDHNFSEKTEPRDWFLTHLVEQNKSVARELDCAPLHIFPGIEVDIGFHVLCLFAPATKVSHLRRVSMILTKLGLAENQRFRSGHPEPLRYNNQTVSLKNLLEMVQNEHNGIVIAAHADEQDGILYDTRHIKDYQLPDLLAVEVTANPPQKKYLDILEGRNSEWSRQDMQPAYVMSSDAKSLKAGDDDKPLPNTVGYRFTWLKTSKPSIEALRQAFLDGDSRIRRQPVRPSDEQTHPRIRGIRVSGLEFLADQEIAFSQNLNTVIGGRGSGKSTLLECLRFALGRENEPSLSEIIKAKIARIAETFTIDTDIQVDWEGVHGQVDTVLLRPRQGRHELTVGEATDFRTYLRHIPVQFFSQQQLSDLTNPKHGNSLLPMIDDACGQDLHALKAREVTLRTEIMQLFAAEDQLVAVRDNITRLKQEITELNRQWQARKDVQQEALAHQRAQAARRYLEQIRSRIAEEVAGIQALAEDIAESHAPLGSEAENWPDAKWFKKLDEQVEKLKQATQIRLLEAAVRYEQDFAAMFEGDAQWPGVDEGLKAAGTRFLEACQERGLQPQDVSRLQEIDRQRQAKQLELTTQEKQEKQLLERVQLLQPRLDDLHGLWRQQHELRLSISNGINEREGKAIKVSVEYMADEASFMATWEQLAPNRSYKIGRNWDDLGKQLFQVFRGQTACLTPWELSLKWVSGEVSANFEELRELFEGHIGANQQKWREVRLTRVADFVDIELRRVEDGAVVGRISDNKLSEGQRNTAVLNLLLAKGEGPIVIDQPEDELDSNFIYQDLVPLLRDMKNRRQLIMATHNANLPVNGDAELIYALEAREGHGRVRTQGGLDRAEVTCAVLDIMEGSAEAFRRRREKYHF